MQFSKLGLLALISFLLGPILSSIKATEYSLPLSPSVLAIHRIAKASNANRPGIVAALIERIPPPMLGEALQILLEQKELFNLGIRQPFFLLLDAGANLALILQETPSMMNLFSELLRRAVEKEDILVVRALLKSSMQGSSLMMNAFGQILWNTIEANHLSGVRVLLEAGINPDWVWENELETPTPLHLISQLGNAGIATLFVDRVRIKNPLNTEGNTPLHIAARYNRWAIAELLLSTHTEVNPLNSLSQTPLDLAVASNNAITASIIANHGGYVTQTTFSHAEDPLKTAISRAISDLASGLPH